MSRHHRRALTVSRPSQLGWQRKVGRPFGLLVWFAPATGNSRCSLGLVVDELFATENLGKKPHSRVRFLLRERGKSEQQSRSVRGDHVHARKRHDDDASLQGRGRDGAITAPAPGAFGREIDPLIRQQHLDVFGHTFYQVARQHIA